MNKENLCFIKCGQDAMVVEFIDDTETFNISYWRTGFLNKLSFKNRIIYCLRFMFLGKPFLEQITFNQDATKQLCVYLKKYNEKLPASIQQAIKTRN
tara:strand:+ start:124 stop:414 length:291 start_codon:yes stop_codon:yes gene_type:complete